MQTRKKIEKSKHAGFSDQENAGIIPPQAIEIETAVLGAMLLQPSCVDTALSILKPESFYNQDNQIIFRAIMDMRSQGKVIDMLTVTEYLKKVGKLEAIGGEYHLAILTNKVASASHLENHSRIVQDKFIQRELIRISIEVQDKAYNDLEDPLDIITKLNLDINNLLSENQVEGVEPIREILKDRIREIETISKHKSELIGIPSGLTILDRSTGGWQNSDLVIIAARPSQGKTAFSLYTGLQAASFKYPVAFFSLEMSKPQLIDRALSSMTAISPLMIRSGRMDWQELEVGIGKLENLPFYIDDTPALTITKLRAKIMQAVKRFGIKLVIIDYLQLMIGDGDNREQEISSISRGLKTLAKETRIPVIALSQLNRAADGKRPILSNLRESGAIEQDADLVIFIHRPEKYGVQTDDNGNSTKGLCELIIDKHRNGPCGLITCYTNEFCTRFANIFDELIINEKSNCYESLPY